jgi:hypothetical protein
MIFHGPTSKKSHSYRCETKATLDRSGLASVLGGARLGVPVDDVTTLIGPRGSSLSGEAAEAPVLQDPAVVSTSESS